jgi:hypothetical protein
VPRSLFLQAHPCRHSMVSHIIPVGSVVPCSCLVGGSRVESLQAAAAIWAVGLCHPPSKEPTCCVSLCVLFVGAVDVAVHGLP